MITSHAGVVLGVAHGVEAHRFIADFGLPLRRTSGEAVFDLEKGSSSTVRHEDDTTLPPAIGTAGTGYNTDNYHLDERWQPMPWAQRFGMLAWIAGDMPPFWRDEHDRNVFSVPDSHPTYNPYQPASGADAAVQEKAA